MEKLFLSFEDQIDYLEDKKDLIITDHEYAKSMLKQIGYFGLISGYKTPFKNPTTKRYYGTHSSLFLLLFDFFAFLSLPFHFHIKS